MKRILIILFVLTSVSVSQTISNTAGAQVNLIKPISIVPLAGDINFGEIILTGAAFNAALLPRSGKLFEIVGQPDRQITISFSSITLDNNVWASTFQSEQGTLTYNPQVITDSDQPVISGGTYSLINTGNVATLSIWVGGSLNIAANQPEGDYEGLFTITVSY